MNKIENKLGISIGVVLAILLFLMSFGGEIEALNKDKVFTAIGIGEGVFFTMKDFLTYHVFIIGCVLSVLYLLLIIGQREKDPHFPEPEFKTNYTTKIKPLN